MPFELRPYPNPTLSPKSEYIQNGWKNSVKPLSERFGVKMQLPDMDETPHTHLAHEGFQFAKPRGKGNEYAEAVLQAYWQDSRNIGEIEVLAEIAASVGLDAEEFKQSLINREFENTHKQALRHSYQEAAITAVPTFMIGSQRVQGLHTQDMLERIISKEIESTSPITGDSCGTDGC